MKVFTGFDFNVFRFPTPSNCLQLSKPTSPTTARLDNPLERKHTHTWTTEERTILCILERWFSSSQPKGNKTTTLHAIRMAFITYFANSTAASKETRAELTVGAINSQLVEIWQEGKQSDAWNNVYVGTDVVDSDNNWGITRAELRDIISENGIELTDKVQESQVQVEARQGTGTRAKKRKTRDIDFGVLGNCVDLFEDAEDRKAINPKRRRSNPSSFLSSPRKTQQCRQPNGFLTPPASPEKWYQEKLGCPKSHPSSVNFIREKMQQARSGRYLTPDPFDLGSPPNSPCAAKKRRQINKGKPMKQSGACQEICSIAFRTWDDNSHGTNTPKGFRAGAFPLASIDPIPPPDCNSQIFRDTAITHLTPLNKPSCLISVTTSPLRTLHRFTQSTSNANVAVIDLEYVKLHQPLPHPRLYRAKDVIHQFGIFGVDSKTGQKYYYSGAREFLIWGNIEPEAIIGVFSKLDLLEYSWTYPKLREVLRLNTLQEVTTASEYKKVLKNTVVKMDETTGYSLGHFLGCIVKLPLSRLESAALLFAKSLKFKGNNSLQSTFLAGAKAGYHAYLYQLFPSENLPSVAVVINRSTKPWKVPGNNFDDFLKSRKRIEDILSLGHY